MADSRIDRRRLFQTTAIMAGSGLAARPAVAIPQEESRAGSPKLKITSVKTFLLRHQPEPDQSENPWRNGLAKGAFPLEDGMIRVPTGPGLGIDVDEEMVLRYSV